MAFISNEQRDQGRRVVLTRDVEVAEGVFQSGTVMTVIDNTNRGYNLIDDKGNCLYDTNSDNFRDTNWQDMDWTAR